MKQLPYTESSVFLVPLRGGGYARGVVARVAPKGKVLFGYFFGPVLSSLGDALITDLEAKNAILLRRFGDPCLLKGEPPRGTWPIIGTVPNWHKEQWPMPNYFAGTMRIAGNLVWRVRYSDADPNEIVERELVGKEDVAGWPEDGLSACGAVEIRLTKLLRPTS